MKKLSKLFLLSTLSISLIACSSSEQPETDQKDTEPKTEEKQETIYKIGETWEVPDGWKLTVNSLKPTDERNEYYDEENGNPAAVYIIDYSYTNEGYKNPDGTDDGLYIDLASSEITDAGNKVVHSYPIDSLQFPDNTPIGATCDGQQAIAVETPGTIKIHTYDYLDGKRYDAEFELTPEE